MAGYSYTTIVVSRDEPTQIGVTFYLDDEAWIRVPGAGKDRCHLSLEHGDIRVSIAPINPAQITTTDVDAARKLAEATATYLAEMQRLHAAHTTRDEPDAANAA